MVLGTRDLRDFSVSKVIFEGLLDVTAGLGIWLVSG